MKKKYFGFLGLAITSIVLLIFWRNYQTAQLLQQKPVTITPNDKILAPAIIDAPNDITRIPSAQSGVLRHIHVVVGDKVHKGQLLFSLENTLVKNALRINKLNLEQTQNDIIIKKQQLKFLNNQLRQMQSLDARAISKAEILAKKNEIKIATAQLKQANYNILANKASMQQTQLLLGQLAVRAPKDGIILQINAHQNEFVNAGQPIIFLGDAKKIIVRVSLDEREAYRFDSKAEAVLLNFANGDANMPLKFIQLDRYIVTQERLNSRVQEVLYSLDREAYPNLVAGQLYDVSITLSRTS